MATQLQLRRGNTAQTAIFTGAIAEVTVDTDQDTVVIHDGTTVGGHYVINTTQLSSNVSILQGVNSGQNTTITAVNNFANSAYNQANNAFSFAGYVNGVANDAFFAANTGIALAQSAFNSSNTNSNSITIIQGVNSGQNTTITALNNFAASAYDTANNAYTTANGANGMAIGAFSAANTAYSYATQVQGIADAAFLKANAAFNSSNLVNQFAQGAYNQANSSTLLAQSAYDTANLKFNTSGGNINGDVTITANNDLTVTGNLYVLGNTVSFGTQTLEVVDPMILLAAGNYTTDLLDIGFAGSYNDGANAHTGLFREHSTKEWYLFQGYTPEVSGNNDINIADASFRTANLHADYVKANVIATTAVIGDRNILSYTQSAFDAANTANTRANDSVLKSGDTMTGSLTGVTTLGTTTISFAQTDATTNTFTTASTAQVSVDAWPTATYRSAKYFVQITSGSSYHIIELNLVHDGTTVFLAQYGEVITNASLGTFDADISGSTVRLLFTGTNAVSVVRVLRTVMDV